MGKMNEYQEKRKGKVVSYYITREMADVLDKILTDNQKRHGIKSRNDLILKILSTFIGSYYFEQDKFYQTLWKIQSLGLGKMEK